MGLSFYLTLTFYITLLSKRDIWENAARETLQIMFFSVVFFTKRRSAALSKHIYNSPTGSNLWNLIPKPFDAPFALRASDLPNTIYKHQDITNAQSIWT